MRRSIALLMILLPMGLVLASGACGGSAQAPRETGTAASPAEPPPPLFASAAWPDVLPAGAQGVAGMRVPALLASEAVQLAGMAVPVLQARIEALRRHVQDCGLDFPDDLHTLVIGWYPGAHVVVLIRGSFDRAHYLACHEQAARRGHPLERTEIAGHEAHVLDHGAGHRAWLALPMAGTLIVADRPAVLEAVLTRDTPRMAADSGPLSTWLARVPKDHDLWGAGLVPPNGHLAIASMQMFGGVSAPMAAVYGTADVAAGLAARVHGVMQSDADAEALVGRASQQLTFIRPGLMLDGSAFLLDRLTLDTDGAIARVRVDLTVEDLVFIRDRVAPAAP